MSISTLSVGTEFDNPAAQQSTVVGGTIRSTFRPPTFLQEEMEMGHNVGKQAERAVERSGKTKDAALTPLQLIQSLRNNLRANLFIPSHQTQALLDAYDSNHAALLQSAEISRLGTQTIELLGAEIEQLKAQVEEFRPVYEQENRTTTVQVALSEEGETKVLETIAVDGPVPSNLPEAVNAAARGIA